MMIFDQQNAAKILEKALKFEVEGYYFYKQYSQEISDEKTKKLFELLCDEEKKHYKKISELFQKHAFDEYQSFQTRYRGDYLESGAFEKIKFENDKPLLIQVKNYAIKKEKDFIEYYGKLRDELLDDGLRQVFDDIIEQEKGHVKLLEKI